MPVPPTEIVTVLSEEYSVVPENAASTVTTVPEAPSLRLDRSRLRFTDGAESLSVRVMLPAVTEWPVLLPVIPMVSLPSTSLSSVGVKVKLLVPVVLLAGIVMSKLDLAAE